LNFFLNLVLNNAKSLAGKQGFLREEEKKEELSWMLIN
jgi:hypothetical protein